MPSKQVDEILGNLAALPLRETAWGWFRRGRLTKTLRPGFDASLRAGA
jgi:hypothetical protein